MRQQLERWSIIIVCTITTAATATAQYATQVVSFDAGTTGIPGYDNPGVATGAPERFTGEGSGFDAVVSPFNSPYLASEVVSIGEGGHLTLQLSHFVVPQAGPEIGVFVNVGLADTDFPNGLFGTPFTAFGVDRAVVDVSEFGTSWINLGEFEFDLPTNGYADTTSPFQSTPGAEPADFQQPFTGALADFQSLQLADILDLLAGSGGGTWLDISTAGLARVGYVRFSVPDDGDPNTALNFDLDGVSIAHGAAGARVPEPAAWCLAGIAALVLASRRRAA